MRAPRPLASLLTGLLLGTGATAAVLAWNPFGWGLVDSRPPNAAETGSAPAEERRILYWRAPMDPSFRSDKPGKSPMGMDLVPVYSGAEADADAPDGTVRVSSGFLQNFAVRTAEARRGAIPVSIRTVGVLAHNEEKLVSVNTKFRGWIEHARVHNVGEHVERGDVLFDIYSPDLVTTQREYLAALEYVERLRDAGAYPETVERARSLREAARERLRYWDMTEAQISQLAESGAAPRTVRFFAPASGFIVEKMGDSLEGLALAPGVTVLKIADHSTLWAQAEFYEEDLRHVREGSPASIEVDAFPGRRWTGTILFFRSAVNPETRALTAFVEVENADLALRPMMYVDVTVRAAANEDAVLVPAESVLHTGERSVVVVQRDDGGFEPREVELGRTADAMQEIASGLAAGERVVVSSQFLIDSESNLRAAISQLSRGEPGGEPGEEPRVDDAPAADHRHH